MLRKPKRDDYKSEYRYIQDKQNYNRILDPDKAQNQEHPFRQFMKSILAQRAKKKNSR